MSATPTYTVYPLYNNIIQKFYSLSEVSYTRTISLYLFLSSPLTYYTVKTLLIMIVISVSSLSRLQAQNVSNEETAIKQVITDETQAFMGRNQEKWSDAWVHEPYISWSSERAPHQLLGWESISQALSYNFALGQPPRPAIFFQRDDYQVSVLGTVATASFTQTAKNGTGKALGKSREVRILEKQNSSWRLIYTYSRSSN